MPLEPIVPFSYRKGSIVTIECWNFVTYTHAAIHPNSRLNLIVGPNGSGKSSIVCAMCLGMGGKPSLLGRGNYAKDYVKHGENLATIEISMATGTGKEVLVLKREIITNYERTDDKTEWYFGSGRDAKKCKLKEIQAVVAAYNIQLSNYTQFLPQDIVKLFPALTSQQLLMRTEDALDDAGLKTKHEKLIELKSASSEKDGTHRVKQKHLQEMETQQEKLRTEVEKFKEWEKVNSEIEKMKLREPSLRFEIQQTKATELKALRKEAKQQYNCFCKELEAAKAPLDEHKEEMLLLQTDYKKMQGEKRAKENQHKLAKTTLEQMGEEVDARCHPFLATTV